MHALFSLALSYCWKMADLRGATFPRIPCKQGLWRVCVNQLNMNGLDVGPFQDWPIQNFPMMLPHDLLHFWVADLRNQFWKWQSHQYPVFLNGCMGENILGNLLTHSYYQLSKILFMSVRNELLLSKEWCSTVIVFLYFCSIWYNHSLTRNWKLK